MSVQFRFIASKLKIHQHYISLASPLFTMQGKLLTAHPPTHTHTHIQSCTHTHTSLSVTKQYRHSPLMVCGWATVAFSATDGCSSNALSTSAVLSRWPDTFSMSSMRPITLTTCTTKWINGVLGHNSALTGYTGLGITRANEMNIVMNHVPGAGSIPRPVDQQSHVLPLYHHHNDTIYDKITGSTPY